MTHPFLSTEVHPDVFEAITDQASLVDRDNLWPESQLNLLRNAGIMAWGIPAEFGGREVSSRTQACLFLDLSTACLTTAFVLSQRNAAVQRLVACENLELKQDLLPKLARGELWTTVGISHLSTSRQHLKKPAVQATETDRGFRLSGFVPWVTGADRADLLVTGGTLEDHRQVLVVVPSEAKGIEPGPNADMLALTASSTGNLQLHELIVPADSVVAGPVEAVMKSGGGGTGSLTTSVITAGVARRAVLGLRSEAEKRDDLRAECLQLERECEQLVEDILQVEEAPECGVDRLSPQSIRTRANSLVLRASQAYLTATKGSGFLKGHPAERTIREAMFFLVWSCPAAVAQSAMREFACTPTLG